MDELNIWGSHAQRLACELATAGIITDPAWQRVVAAVPRHAFLPEFWADAGEEGQPPKGRRYTAQTPGYLDVVYSDDTLVTQHIERNGFPWATSSSTAPSLMLRMLQELDVSDGMSVLEVGTGTGYNAALLSQRLGEASVTSIDIDPELIHLADQRLKEAGYRPTLAARDGRNGYSDRAPYDRLIATVAFDHLPARWLAPDAVRRDHPRRPAPRERHPHGGAGKADRACRRHRERATAILPGRIHVWAPRCDHAVCAIRPADRQDHSACP